MGPTSEQRLAYKDWVLADEAAINARDAVLTAIQAADGLIDLEKIERLSARAIELRECADRALHHALALLHGQERDPRDSRFASIMDAIVSMEVHQITRVPPRRVVRVA
jgi:dTDP-4-amino-4,6-dideoxygalactose transaminase